MCSVLLDVNANTINPINVPIDGSRRKLSNGGHIISGRLERSSSRDFWTGVVGGFVCGMRGRSSTKHPGIIFILLQGGFLARIGGYRWKERDEAVLEHYTELNSDLLKRMTEYVSSWSRVEHRSRVDYLSKD